MGPPEPVEGEPGKFKRKRIRQSFPTKKQAQAELTSRDYTIQQGTYEDPRKYQNFTLEQLTDLYTETHQHQRGFATSKKYHIQKIKEHFGTEHLPIGINYAAVSLFRAHLQQTPNKHGKPRKPATINRTLSTLRHMMGKAVEWDMLRQNPFEKGAKLHLKEDNLILRFLSEDEIESLLAVCTGNMVYLNDIITCAINTGMRKMEILTLKWDQIKNGQIYVTGKGEKPREIPVSEDAKALFKGIRKREGLRSKYVFTYHGKPIADNVKNGFKSALRKAGITNCRFHDLRHTFSSHFVMRGGDLKTLQEILGHADIKTTMRYAHLSQQHKANAINLVCGLTSGKKSAMSEVVRNSVVSADSTKG